MPPWPHLHTHSCSSVSPWNTHSRLSPHTPYLSTMLASQSSASLLAHTWQHPHLDTGGQDQIMMRMSAHLSGVTPATHWPVKTSGHVTLSQGAQVSPRHVTQVRVTRRSLVSSPMMARSPVVTSQGGSGDGTGAAWAVKPNTLTTGSDPTLIFLTHGRSRSPQRRCNTTLSAPDLA